VVVYFVAEARLTLSILPDHPLKIDRGSIWINKPRPDHLNSILPIRYAMVISADQP
jgi:hypothetical protein